MSIKKMSSCKNNSENSYTNLSINLQDIHGVQYAHLMIQKANTIFIGERLF